jgi:hypothetical protein
MVAQNASSQFDLGPTIRRQGELLEFAFHPDDIDDPSPLDERVFKASQD